MTIDLNKFIEKKEVVVPVKHGKFQYGRKNYVVSLDCMYTRSLEAPGWYRVAISGNEASIIGPIVLEAYQHSFPVIKGYTFDDNIVFQNFDVAKRKSGLGVMEKIYFLGKISTFSPIEAIMWEDKNLYFYRPVYTDIKIIEVFRAFKNEQPIANIKGVTPEQQTVYLLHELKIQRIKANMEKIKLQQEREEFKKTLEGKLFTAFSRAGAEVINYKETSNELEVNWKLLNGEQFNSRIERDTFKIIELGYCAEGGDRNHNITSMVLTAEEWDKDDLIYKTRR